ncbi:MAG: hypothetical protein V4739_11340 [Pseudomonadota bacterium]
MNTSRNNVAINELMKRHGIHRGSERRKLFCLLLNCSYATARRRDIEGGWTTDEVEKFVHHFGESLETVLGSEPVGAEVDCQIQFGGPLWLKGKVSTGSVVHERAFDGLLATQSSNGEWLVRASSEVPLTETAFAVEKLVYMAAALSARPQIAVVEDDEDSLFALTRALSGLGFDARGYPTAEDLLSTPFDENGGFLIDWYLGVTTAAELLSKIRERAPTAPIFLLTGKAGISSAEDAQLAQILRQFNLLFHQKPVAPIIIADQLHKYLSQEAE